MAPAKKGKNIKRQTEEKPSRSQPSRNPAAVEPAKKQVEPVPVIKKPEVEKEESASSKQVKVVSLMNLSVKAQKISPKDVEDLKASIKKNGVPAPLKPKAVASTCSTEPCSSASSTVIVDNASDAESLGSVPSTNSPYKSPEELKKGEEGRGSSMEPQAGSSISFSPEKKLRGKITPKPKTRPPVRKSKKAGLTFPVGRIHRKLKKATSGARISPTGAVYAAAVLEYLTAELVEIAGVVARRHQRKSIKPRHLYLAIKEDEEIENLLGKVILPESGALPSPAGLLQRQGFPLLMLKKYCKKYSD